jgi:hypothetical protein
MPGRACAELREARKRAGDVLRWSNLRPRGYPEATLDAPRTTRDGQLGTRCHHRSIEPLVTRSGQEIADARNVAYQVMNVSGIPLKVLLVLGLHALLTTRTADIGGCLR